MRKILIDWLVDVHLKYNMKQDTLFLAINFIDRFCARRQVLRSEYQLVGVSCMLLAAKYEEIYPPYVETFKYITDNAYTKE